MSKPVYRSDSEHARAEMLRANHTRGQRPLTDDERQRRAHQHATVEVDRVENAKRNAVNQLSRTVHDDASYRRAVVAVERAMTVIDVEQAILDAESLKGETCGDLCKCAAMGACSVISPEEAANGCVQPAFARDTATPFMVWGYNGLSFPGKPASRCHCGKHESAGASPNRADERRSDAATAREEMLRANYDASRKG